jgi:hypothetical protein
MGKVIEIISVKFKLSRQIDETAIVRINAANRLRGVIHHGQSNRPISGCIGSDKHVVSQPLHY